ncbi:hypothetical protein FACS1894198_2000 [Clostridia bacterium]|nr:hypothetical protein FACS1894198_2000 [Clostridia bacterium]
MPGARVSSADLAQYITDLVDAETKLDARKGKKNGEFSIGSLFRLVAAEIKGSAANGVLGGGGGGGDGGGGSKAVNIAQQVTQQKIAEAAIEANKLNRQQAVLGYLNKEVVVKERDHASGKFIGLSGIVSSVELSTGKVVINGQAYPISAIMAVGDSNEAARAQKNQLYNSKMGSIEKRLNDSKLVVDELKDVDIGADEQVRIASAKGELTRALADVKALLGKQLTVIEVAERRLTAIGKQPKPTDKNKKLAERKLALWKKEKTNAERAVEQEKIVLREATARERELKDLLDRATAMHGPNIL